MMLDKSYYHVSIALLHPASQCRELWSCLFFLPGLRLQKAAFWAPLGLCTVMIQSQEEGRCHGRTGVQRPGLAGENFEK